MLIGVLKYLLRLLLELQLLHVLLLMGRVHLEHRSGLHMLDRAVRRLYGDVGGRLHLHVLGLCGVRGWQVSADISAKELGC